MQNRYVRKLISAANLHEFSFCGLISNCAAYGSILTLAEFTQQKIQTYRDETKSTDFHSLGRYAVLGSTVISPLLYTYYCWLDATFPGHTWRPVLKKVANDVLFANIAYYSAFYYGMSLLEHRDHKRAKSDLKQNFGVSYIMGMVYWIPVMATNFAFISPKHRVIFIACASFVEMNGLCLMRRQTSQKKEEG